jgi:hypothetical protein
MLRAALSIDDPMIIEETLIAIKELMVWIDED